MHCSFKKKEVVFYDVCLLNFDMRSCGYGHQNRYAYDTLNNVWFYLHNKLIILWYISQSITCLVSIWQCVGWLVGTVITDKPQHGLRWWSLTENHSLNIALLHPWSVCLPLHQCLSCQLSDLHWRSVLGKHSLSDLLSLSSFHPPTQVPGSPFNTLQSDSKDI